jgi:hypothetical protein
MMNDELHHLAQLPGVQGVCLHRGSEVVYHRLPDALSDSAAALAESVANTFASYQQSGRPANQVLFQYPEGVIFAITVLAAPREAEDSPAPSMPYLTFLLQTKEAALPLMPQARTWLARYAAGDPQRWPAIRAEFIKIMAPAFSDPEAVLQDVLKRLKLTDQMGVTRDDLMTVGRTVVAQVPQVGQRGALLAAMESLVPLPAHA